MQTKRRNIAQVTTWFIQVFALVVLFALLGIVNVGAQDSQPPSAWDEVINPDGSINYDNLTDNGLVQQEADFMPTVFGQPILAEYHVYTTPSGNQVLMPNATTLAFMAADPHNSGFSSASTTMGTNGSAMTEGQNYTGFAGLGLLFSGEAQFQLGQPGANSNFFEQVLAGQTNLFAANPAGLFNFLESLSNPSLTDFNLYTYMLLYTPGSCALSPAGCTPEQLALLLNPPPTGAPTPPPPPGSNVPPPPIQCPGPSVIPGAISYDGSKTGPNYPLVVGQDPDSRGVDLRFSASVAPTIYITYELEPDIACVESPGSSGGYGCSQDEEPVQVGWYCREVRQEFPECIASARGSASLSQESRNWILHELSNRYPGARLKNPDFGFSSSSSCTWSSSERNVQIADPGYWNLSVRGGTSGTPVSAPRTFGGNVERFEVWLKETAIIK